MNLRHPILAIAFLAACFLASPSRLPAAIESPLLTPSEARKKVGEEVVVEMTVSVTKDRLEKRGEIYLDAEVDFRDPNNFAVVISKVGAKSLNDAGIASPAEHFLKKKIRAKGKVALVQNVPRITIDDAKQIELVTSSEGK